MDKYAELDEHVRFAQQWKEDISPVILMKIFHVYRAKFGRDNKLVELHEE